MYRIGGIPGVRLPQRWDPRPGRGGPPLGPGACPLPGGGHQSGVREPQLGGGVLPFFASAPMASHRKWGMHRNDGGLARVFEF